MGTQLSYCPEMNVVLDRLRRFYQDRSQQTVLAVMNVPGTALEDFARTHEHGFCEYPDPRERIQ